MLLGRYSTREDVFWRLADRLCGWIWPIPGVSVCHGFTLFTIISLQHHGDCVYHCSTRTLVRCARSQQHHGQILIVSIITYYIIIYIYIGYNKSHSLLVTCYLLLRLFVLCLYCAVADSDTSYVRHWHMFDTDIYPTVSYVRHCIYDKHLYCKHLYCIYA